MAEGIGPWSSSLDTSSTITAVNGATRKLGRSTARNATGATVSASTPASPNGVVWGTSTATSVAYTAPPTVPRTYSVVACRDPPTLNWVTTTAVRTAHNPLSGK